MPILEKLFGTRHDRVIKKIQPLVARINDLESAYRSMPIERFPELTKEWKARVQSGTSLDDILPDVFAAVREVAKRKVNMRPFDVQLIGGVILHQGKIAEMKTGEGKTLVATMPIVLNALAGKGVHLVTVNDYLARRDAEWMGPIYETLGLTVGIVQHGQSPEEKKKAYAADITYGTNNEFGFDYLRDNMVAEVSQMVQRTTNAFSYGIVDEVDSILIDEARTPLIISAPDMQSTKMYEQFSRIAPNLQENEHFNKDEKTKSVLLTDKGIDRVQEILGIKNIYEEQGIQKVHHLEQALKAHFMYQKDKDYVIKDGEILIVDEFTGRLMPGRRYSGGLHQAIEAKEGVRVQQESKTMATITFQNYFRMYQKLAGMTGTAVTSAEEFEEVYNLDVVVIPTNAPVHRSDLSDRIYSTEAGKFKAVVSEIAERHQKGQPVLVGTIAIEKSELLSARLTAQGVPHEVLNAKQHEREAEIVKNAGQKGAVTIATNMAGRGTDIKLGTGVVELGGLHILGTERHEARRIDNQLRGRSGRQGDPGSSQFFVSMEDDLMRVFGSDRMKNMMKTLGLPEEQAIENRVISRSIEKAQEKVEGHNFDIRKHVLQYDDVMNKQRDAIYKKRREVLKTYEDEKNRAKLKETIFDYYEEEIENLVSLHANAQPWNIAELKETMRAMLAESDARNARIDEIASSGQQDAEKRSEITELFLKEIKERYNEREREFGEDVMRQIEKAVILRTIDLHWLEHLDNMTHLRDAVSLRGYGQRDPLVEYKREGYQMFARLLDEVRSEITNSIMKVNVVSKKESPMEHERMTTNAPEERSTPKQLQSKKVGRNEPCPCGSGKKYKKCHGA